MTCDLAGNRNPVLPCYNATLNLSSYSSFPTTTHPIHLHRRRCTRPRQSSPASAHRPPPLPATNASPKSCPAHACLLRSASSGRIPRCEHTRNVFRSYQRCKDKSSASFSSACLPMALSTNHPNPLFPRPRLLLLFLPRFVHLQMTPRE